MLSGCIKFGIRHLFLLMGWCALTMCLERAAYDFEYADAFELREMPMRAAALAGLFAVGSTFAGRSVVIQPGEWLWLILGVSKAMQYGVVWAVASGSLDWQEAPRIDAMLYLLSGALVVAAAAVVRIDLRWRLLYCVAGLYFSARSMLCWYIWYEMLPIGLTYNSLRSSSFLIAIATTMCCVACDYGEWHTRRWAHWIGVCLWIWMLCR